MVGFPTKNDYSKPKTLSNFLGKETEGRAAKVYMTWDCHFACGDGLVLGEAFRLFFLRLPKGSNGAEHFFFLKTTFYHMFFFLGTIFR